MIEAHPADSTGGASRDDEGATDTTACESTGRAAFGVG